MLTRDPYSRWNGGRMCTPSPQSASSSRRSRSRRSWSAKALPLYCSRISWARLKSAASSSSSAMYSSPRSIRCFISPMSCRASISALERRAPRQARRRSPPFVLARAIGAGGRVERVESGHIVVGEREVEDVRVLCDSLAARRFRQDDEAMLKAPADEDLRRRTREAIGDLPHAVVTEMASCAKWAVCLDHDTALLAAV